METSPFGDSLPSPDLTIGALFIGSTVSAIFYGMTNIQVLVYYNSFPQDPRFRKISVAFLWVLDTLHTGLTIYSVYRYVISHSGQNTIPVTIEWSSKFQTIVNAVIILVVQTLYAFKVWRLSGYHRNALGYVAFALILVGFGIGITFAYHVYRTSTFFDLESIKWIITAAFATAAGIDFLIAVTVLICLRQSKSLLLPSMNSRIKTVILYVLITGLLTSLSSLGTLLTYLLMPHNFVYIAMGFVLARLYINSFLGLLNARPRNTESTERTVSLYRGSTTITPNSRRQTLARTWKGHEPSSLTDVDLTENMLTPHTFSSVRSSLRESITSPQSGKELLYIADDRIPRAI